MKKVDAQVEHEVLRHHLVGGWPTGTIARELGVHHDVVRRVLDPRGAAPSELTQGPCGTGCSTPTCRLWR